MKELTQPFQNFVAIFCSNRYTPSLFDVMMSRRPSAFRSAIRKCKPTPLSLWIKCLIQRTWPFVHGPFRTSRARSARTNPDRARCAPNSACR